MIKLTITTTPELGATLSKVLTEALHGMSNTYNSLSQKEVNELLKLTGNINQQCKNG